MRPVKAALMEDMHCIHFNIVLRRTAAEGKTCPLTQQSIGVIR